MLEKIKFWFYFHLKLFSYAYITSFKKRSTSTLLISTIFNSAPYIVTMLTTNAAITDLDLFNNTIFAAINKVWKNQQHAEINAIFKEIIKNDHYKDMKKDVLQQQINMLITEE